MTVSLYRREGSANWWVRYRDANGTLRRKSTRTQDEKIARRIAGNMEREFLRMADDASGETESDDVFGCAHRAEARKAVSDDVTEHIARVERLMLAATRHQAQAQELVAKGIAHLFQELAVRTQRLERILEQTKDGGG